MAYFIYGLFPIYSHCLIFSLPPRAIAYGQKELSPAIVVAA
ncbi:hypothetical protein [Candidatus Synechococcus calcipolaris]|nr:hypothetical protein [Candidatus Synechococcus calcipolaris]